MPRRHSRIDVLYFRIGDLEWVPGVGDEYHQQLRRTCSARVFGEYVVGARLLHPVLALVVRAHGFAIRFASHTSGEHVGVDESLAVPVRHRTGIGREVDDRRGDRLSLDAGKLFLKQWRQRFGGVPRSRDCSGGRLLADYVVCGGAASGGSAQSSVTLMIVLPGTRRSRANAAGVSARGRTAPTMGLSRPSRSRSARSASLARSGSTTKKTDCPFSG